MKKADIGMIGLAVMGENLAMNMESKGFTVAVYNRTTDKVDGIKWMLSSTEEVQAKISSVLTLWKSSQLLWKSPAGSS